MEIASYRSITDIDPISWDSSYPGEALFHSHAFLRSLQQSGVENAGYEFLLFRRHGALVGSAVLSVFEINLDLFIGNESWVKTLKAWLPRLFKVKICFCGTPVSAGHKNLYFTDPSVEKPGIEALTAYMEKKCKTEGIRFLVFKEFYAPDATTMESSMLKGGYFRAFSIPGVMLDVRWPDFKAYLQNLTTGYRRQLKTSLAKTGHAEPLILEGTSEKAAGETGVFWSLERAESLTATEMFGLYLSVMERATIKLEMLNLAFFEAFLLELAPVLRIVRLKKGQESLGLVVLAHLEKELIFIWTAKDHDRKPDFDPYFNLLAGIVQYGIQQKCSRIVLGQTAYYTKRRMGGQLEHLYIYFKSTDRWRHYLLRALNRLIFPEMKFEPLHVFGKASSVSQAHSEKGG